MHETYCKRSNYELVLRSLNHDVEAALCCKSQHPVSLLAKNELEQVKADLQAGIKHKHCTVCWIAESQGQKSWRQIGNDLPMYGKSIEIYFDNTCDQACIYCSPKYSSKWSQEIKFANLDDKKLLKDFVNDGAFEQTPKQNHKDAIMNEIISAGKNALSGEYVAIILLGGEPLLSQQFDKTNILKEIVETFYANADKDVHLRVTMITNANTPDAIIDKTIETSSQLNSIYDKLKITVQLSIESTGKNAEFVRYGLDYNQFLKNYQKYLNSDLKVGFSMAVNTVSYFDTPEFLNQVFAYSKAAKNKIFFNFNIVNYPEFMSLKTLPKKYQYILDQCKQISIDNKENFRDGSFYDRMLTQIQHASSTLGSDVNQRHTINAKRYFEYLERTRQIKITDVSPLLAKEIL